MWRLWQWYSAGVSSWLLFLDESIDDPRDHGFLMNWLQFCHQQGNDRQTLSVILASRVFTMLAPDRSKSLPRNEARNHLDYRG